jgi:hypothetical protein
LLARPPARWRQGGGGRTLHNSHGHGNNDGRESRGEECHDRFVALLGAISLAAFAILGVTSAWRVRRAYYALFHAVAAVVYAAAAAADVAVDPATVAVAIAATTTDHLC